MAKILIMLPSNLIGGAEANLLKVARHLAQTGNEIDVVFLSVHHPKASNWEEVPRINLQYINTPRESLGAVCYAMRSILCLNKVAYDYSITSHVHCNAFVSLLKRLGFLRIERVVVRESTNVFSWFSGFRLLLIRLLYRFYDRNATLICQTARMKTELLENLSYFANRDIRVVANPVDKADIVAKSMIAERKAQNAVKWAKDRVMIVSVGRLVPEKAFDVLLIGLSFLPENFVLTIVGDGPLQSQLRETADALGLRGRVLFLGHLDNPYPLMRQADINVVSSRLEGFPNVLLEMMTLGKRVISTRCADGIETLPGITTCAKEDPIELATAITKSFSQNATALDLSQQEMKEHVSKLSVEKFVKQALV